jgi:hypothetical protein
MPTILVVDDESDTCRPQTLRPRLCIRVSSTSSVMRPKNVRWVRIKTPTWQASPARPHAERSKKVTAWTGSSQLQGVPPDGNGRAKVSSSRDAAVRSARSNVSRSVNGE